jgi:hypothetical protein
MTIKILILLILSSQIVLSQIHFNTKAYGEKVLKGYVKYEEDEELNLFNALDSLFCKNKNTKEFYFKVANKIQQFTDGALSEYFAGIASKYYLSYNSEFIANTNKMTSDDLKNWLNLISWDIAVSEPDSKDLPKIKKRLDALIINCKCDETKKRIIKNCNEIIYKRIIFHKKNN